jgi:3-dehydroquinate dehydratase II
MPGKTSDPQSAPDPMNASGTKPLYILNGPNLNRLCHREPSIYGTATLAQIEAQCRDEAGACPVVFRQTNSEAQLVEWIHEAIDHASAIVINPAAYSFTSIAILDALKMFPGPIIELHISNIHRREAHYHRSYVSLVATAVIAGLGPAGYRLAVRALREMM